MRSYKNFTLNKLVHEIKYFILNKISNKRSLKPFLKANVIASIFKRSTFTDLYFKKMMQNLYWKDNL